MTVQIALLRGINVGGNKLVAMAGLRALFEELGCTAVKSLLQSGNVVFESAKTGAALERWLQARIASRLEVECELFVRTAKEWMAIVANNPFPEEAKRDPARLIAMALRDAPSAAAVKALQAAIKGPERIRAEGRQAYLVYPNGQGTSKLTNAVIERLLDTRGTARNWNTVLKLAALAKSTT